MEQDYKPNIYLFIHVILEIAFQIKALLEKYMVIEKY